VRRGKGGKQMTCCCAQAEKGPALTQARAAAWPPASTSSRWEVGSPRSARRSWRGRRVAGLHPYSIAGIDNRPASRSSPVRACTRCSGGGGVACRIALQPHIVS
jgi:hypothetical protein